MMLQLERTSFMFLMKLLGCDNSIEFEITQPQEITIQVSSSIPTCPNLNNIEATAVANKCCGSSKLHLVYF